MEKRYQVFVSSTYEDLQSERQEVMHALLELDCIPSGMELFPAANADQWTVIKRVIDDCDYYIVVVGGRYGSIGSDGYSYTEMEYRYAVEIGKPCLAFLHGDPQSLPLKKTEQTDLGKQKLAAFRALLQQRLCKSWITSAELGSVVSRGLIRLIKNSAAIGWVRADAVPDENTTREIIRLRHRVEELEASLAQSATHPPSGSESLAQESDPFELNFFGSKYFSFHDETDWRGSVITNWNEIFTCLAPLMINEADERAMKAALDEFIRQKQPATPKAKTRPSHYNPTKEAFGAIIVQLRALGLIVKSEKRRSLKDSEAYWKLTPYGDAVMTRLLAISK